MVNALLRADKEVSFLSWFEASVSIFGSGVRSRLLGERGCQM